MLLLLFSVVAAATVVLAFFILMKEESERAWLGARCFRLQFPRNLEASAVTTFIAGVSGARHAWRPRWTSPPTVVLEVRAIHGRIEHLLLVPRALTGTVLSQLRA